MSNKIRSSVLPAVFTVVCLLAVIMPANAVIQIIDPDGDGSTNVFDNLGMIEFTGSYASPWYPDDSGVGISVGHYDVNSICEPAPTLACGVGELLVNDGDDIRNQGTNNYIGKNIDSSGKVTLEESRVVLEPGLWSNGTSLRRPVWNRRSHCFRWR